MDWAKSSLPKTNSIHGAPPTFRNNEKPLRDNEQNLEVIPALRKAYEDRITSLEFAIREAYGLIENDELLETMKMSEVSEEYRKQRIREIMEETLFGEKEQMIEKLNDTLAALIFESRALESENQSVKQVYQEEVGKFQKTISEFELVLENELKSKSGLKKEHDQLLTKTSELTRTYENILAEKDNLYREAAMTLQTENMQLREILDDMRGKGMETDRLIEERDKQLDNAYKDIDTLKQEYNNLNFNIKNLNAENARFKADFQLIEDTKNRIEHDNNEFRNNISRLEEELRNSRLNVENLLREKTELINKTEYISSQVKKIVENEQKTSADLIDQVKTKYKTKSGEYKRKIQELVEANEVLANENNSNKQQLSDAKAKFDKTISQMQNDMKMIKSEWEKKCQEIDLNSQRVLAEVKSKHQLQINQLQNEYQSLLDKKLMEIQSEATVEISKSRAADIETKSQLESRMLQLDKDYILRNKHENILTTEILSLKTLHAQEMKDLEESYEKQISSKIKEVSENHRNEYESTIATIKGQKNAAEHELAKLRNETQKMLESVTGDREKFEKIITDLESSERNRKELVGRLEETNNNILKLRGLYEEEVRKSKKSEYEAQDLIRRVTEITKHSEDLNSQLLILKKEWAIANEDRNIKEEKIIELQHRNKVLSHENETHSVIRKEIERERDDLNKKIRDLKQELNEESEKLRDALSSLRKEEQSKLEDEVSERNKLQTKLSQTESKLRVISNEVNEKDIKIQEQKTAMARLESYLNDSQTKCVRLETEIAQKDTIIREDERKIDKLKSKFQENKFTVKRVLTHKIDSLKEEIRALRQATNHELERSRKAIEATVSDLVKHFQEKLEIQKIKHKDDKERSIKALTRDFEEKVREIEISKDSIDKNLRFKQREFDECLNENEGLKNEIRDYLQQLDTQKKKIGLLDKDNEVLRNSNNQKCEEFDSLQQFVNKEMKRIKEESERILQGSTQMHEEAHAGQLKVLFKHIDDLKESEVQRLKNYQDELNEVITSFVSDMNQLKTHYNHRMEQYEKELSILETEFQSKKKEKQILKAENERLRDSYNKAREEHQRAIINFEERLEAYKQAIKQEHTVEKGKPFSTNEIEKLNKQNSELQRELSRKNSIIDELNRAREIHKTESEKYKSIASEKEKEAMKVSKSREKEIEELQSLLAKSIQSFSGALDTNSKIAAKLDKETEELMKNVKKTDSASKPRPSSKK